MCGQRHIPTDSGLGFTVQEAFVSVKSSRLEREAPACLQAVASLGRAPVPGPQLVGWHGPMCPRQPVLTTSMVCFPGGMSVSQCSKEDGRSSSGPPHETAAPKRTYDMMEGRVSRAISSASIEGGRPA